tara:strand:- start:771 stop:1019 length:249 start_codon:yes stop_codon:yes gene_type:complete
MEDSKKDIYIVRICLQPLRNPLVIDNMPVFGTYEGAYSYAEKFMKTNKMTIQTNTSFDDRNRNYVYQDFIDEQFIWIEKHNI